MCIKIFKKFFKKHFTFLEKRVIIVHEVSKRVEVTHGKDVFNMTVKILKEGTHEELRRVEGVKKIVGELGKTFITLWTEHEHEDRLDVVEIGKEYFVVE